MTRPAKAVISAAPAGADAKKHQPSSTRDRRIARAYGEAIPIRREGLAGLPAELLDRIEAGIADAFRNHQGLSRMFVDVDSFAVRGHGGSKRLLRIAAARIAVHGPITAADHRRLCRAADLTVAGRSIGEAVRSRAGGRYCFAEQEMDIGVSVGVTGLSMPSPDLGGQPPRRIRLRAHAGIEMYLVC